MVVGGRVFGEEGWKPALLELAFIIIGLHGKKCACELIKNLDYFRFLAYKLMKQKVMIPGISIEPFRGDLEALERMALHSWRDEYGITSFPNFYRPSFLKYILGRAPDQDHLIAAYRGDEIVSFLANLPRRFHYQGKIYRAVLSCIMVTRKELLRQGLGTAIVEAALRVNKKYNYDFSLLTLETGHRSTRMIKKFKEFGHPLTWVKKLYIVARILELRRVSVSESLKGWEQIAIRILGAHRPPKAIADVPLREYRPEDLDMCLDLLNQYQNHVTLARVWEHDELAWELSYPDVSQTLVCEKRNKIEGLINFIYHDHLGKTKERWAWINHVAYPALSGKERLAFVHGFLRYVKDAGCAGVIEWTKKYYSQTPFYRAHFIPYFRAVNMWAWNFNPEIRLQNIPDVHEVQI